MRYSWIFLLAIFAFVPCKESIALDAKELFKNSKGSVVLIMSFDSNNQPLAIGSGFYVDDGRKIATNLHVISGAQVVRIKNPDGKVFKANIVLGIDSNHDLALLKADLSGKPIPLSQRTPEIGEDIIAIGNPKGLEATLSTGIVSGVRNDEGSVYYQITAPISPGSSGGPIINERGKVIGVSTFYVQGGQNLNFAMPVAYIHKLLKSSKRIPLAQASAGKPTKQKTAVTENVKVVDYFIDGSPGRLEGSIFNGSSSKITNIRIVVTYYSKQSGRYPVHFKLISIKEKIPPGLSVRFARGDDALLRHGTTYDPHGRWSAEFRVLDYDIIQQPGGGGAIPLFE